MSDNSIPTEINDSYHTNNSEIITTIAGNLSETSSNHSQVNSENENTNYLYLLIVEDHKNKRIINLTKNAYCLGRGSDVDILIQDPQISRKHATIIKEFNHDRNVFLYKIIDGDSRGKLSKNGLNINGQKLKIKYLEHGDSIRLSDHSKIQYFVIDKHSKFTDFFLKVNTENQSNFQEEEYYKKTLTSTVDLNFTHELNTKDEQLLKYVWKLSSFAELSPYPIIEINLQGKITYVNQAASFAFPNLDNTKLSHPILKDLLTVEEQIHHGSLFVRDVQIQEQIYEQYIHYLSDLKVIRSYLFDRTERKQMEEKLRDSEARYRAVIEQMYEGVFLCDAKHKTILESNTSASKMLDYSTEELIGKRLDYFLTDCEDSQKFEQNVEQMKIDKISFRQEMEYRTKNNNYFNVEVSLSIINYDQEEVISLVFRDISQQKQLETRLKYRAYHDSLTGLYNRDLFLDYLGKALANAKRNHRLLGVMFLDIDYFKQVNDNYGHDIGDNLLQEFSLRLKQSLREGDIISRWGGDEFTILLPTIHDKLVAINVARRIISSMKQPFIFNDIKINTSSSIGISVYPDNAQDIDSLLKKADEALYVTKNKGRNGYTVADLEL